MAHSFRRERKVMKIGTKSDQHKHKFLRMLKQHTVEVLPKEGTPEPPRFKPKKVRLGLKVK